MKKVGVDRIESIESSNTATGQKICPDFADIVSLEAANANERRQSSNNLNNNPQQLSHITKSKNMNKISGNENRAFRDQKNINFFANTNESQNKYYSNLINSQQNEINGKLGEFHAMNKLQGPVDNL